MKELEYKDLPASWAYCFNEQCSKKDSCMKYLTTTLIPADVNIGRVVLPKYYDEPECEYYHEKARVRVASGFEKLYCEVKKKEVAVIRQELYDILDSRTSYYRYSSGEKFLTPEQQEQVLAVFRNHGYTENLEFDKYKEVWNV